MKTLSILLTALLLLPATAPAEEEEDKGMTITAWSFSDLSVPVTSGGVCADFLAYLMGPAKNYKLLSTATIQGPPGVVYTLQNNRGEIGILKCSAIGGHDDGGGGGGCGG
jgi:hypothetical protein